MKHFFSVIVILALLTGCGKKQNNTPSQTHEEQKERIISLNGTLTEILVDLGKKDEIIGVDITSTYPVDIKENTKNLDHVSKISIESLIALNPTVIYAIEKELPEKLKEQLSETSIRLVLFDQEYSIEGTKNLITGLAQSLDMDPNLLVAKIDDDIQSIPSLDPKPSVLFIYARGSALLMVAGTDTPIDQIISISGGQNAITEFRDYKTLTPEALLTHNPDYILLFDTGLQSLGGVEGVLKIEGISQTNAGKNKRIIAMDGLFLSGFGPRVAEAAKELNTLLSSE